MIISFIYCRIGINTVIYQFSQFPKSYELNGQLVSSNFFWLQQSSPSNWCQWHYRSSYIAGGSIGGNMGDNESSIYDGSLYGRWQLL